MMNKKIKNAFNEIGTNDDLKQKTFQSIVSKNKKLTPIYYKIPSVMVLFVVAIFSGLYYSPKSYISIDINPSIEIELNVFNKVINVNASNEDGKTIVENVDLKYLGYVDALEKLDNSQIFNEYSDKYIEITVVSNTTENSEKIIKNINACAFSERGNVTCFSKNQELKEEALKYDISFGKYRAYLELLEVNPNITIEDIKDLPMKTIREMIDFQDDSGTINRYGNQNRNGNGNKYGD